MIERPEPLGRRLGRFGLFIGAIFAVSAGVVITQRLSEDALALLVGLTCGVAAMAPTIGLVLLAWRREETRRHKTHTQGPYAGAPPVIVVTPQALPGYGQQRAATPEQWGWHPNQTAERQFTIVGGEE